MFRQRALIQKRLDELWVMVKLLRETQSKLLRLLDSDKQVAKAMQSEIDYLRLQNTQLLGLSKREAMPEQITPIPLPPDMDDLAVGDIFPLGDRNSNEPKGE